MFKFLLIVHNSRKILHDFRHKLSKTVYSFRTFIARLFRDFIDLGPKSSNCGKNSFQNFQKANIQISVKMFCIRKTEAKFIPIYFATNVGNINQIKLQHTILSNILSKFHKT